MPITLADAKNLSQSKLTNFVIDEFQKSALLDSLTFDNTVKPQGGKTMAYVYNRVTTAATAATRAINTEYTPQEAKTTQVTVNLGVFGGAFEIDRVIAENEQQVLDLVQFQIQQKTQATIALFHDLFINGDTGTDAHGFDGLSKALKGKSTEITADTALDLSGSQGITTNWQAFLDLFRKLRGRMDGTPTLYLMNSDMLATFQSVTDRAGLNTATKQGYGDEVLTFGNATLMALGDKPGTANPIIPTTDGLTDIYAVRLGLDGVHGISPEGNKLVRTYLPDFTTPGAVKRGEVEMIASMAVKSTRSAAVLRGIKIA